MFAMLSALLTQTALIAQTAPPPATAPSAPAAAVPAARAGGRGGVAGGQRTLLIWADTRNGQSQHDMTSHAMAVIERLGYESGAYRSFIRTDSEIISYSPQKTTGGNASGGPSLGSVDAIFSLTHREAPLPDTQKAELLKFIKEDGKGFVSAHTGLTAFQTWPEFAEVIGGKYSPHLPIGKGTVINEDPNFPATKDWPAKLEMVEEWYNLTNYSRDQIHVVLRLDLSDQSPGYAALAQVRGEWPLAWAKMYGNGRVFYSAFGHAPETWDNPMIQKMLFEAIKWALKLTDADITPRPLPKEAAAPVPAPRP